MTQVIRYFHIRQPGSMKGGATVRVVGTPGEAIVQIQVSECSHKDNFCRKTGRDVAVKKPIQRIHLGSLPEVLSDVFWSVVKRDKTIPRRYKVITAVAQSPDYSFSTKYFTVKETTQQV